MLFPRRRLAPAFLFCGIFFLTLALASQALAGIGFQPVNPDELKMTTEPKAPGAAAIILFRQVERDDTGNNPHEDSYYRIKILKEEGRKYANVEIQFSKADGQSVYNIKAVSYTHLKDGGWGESCKGYETLQFEPHASTPSQTAWAVIGLVSAGEAESEAARKGVEWLQKHQRQDGTWEENGTTGTGFPNVFYIKYHLYRDYFPLLALACYAKAVGELGKLDRGTHGTNEGGDSSELGFGL